ncbi:hypothetical protein JW707_04385 [Candidatus Woesearchaeota archaeon]|nr:hypothetical protein [Candidatus Woesearchaeota archaeon]
MELLNYILASLIVSLGLICGVILGFIAKEEIKPGRKYLIFLQYAIVAVILVLTVYFRFDIEIVFLLVAGIFFVLYRTRLKKQIMPEIYVLFAVIFASAKAESFIVQSSLIFLYGFPTGSLMVMEKNWLKKVLVPFCMFLAVSAALFFLV